MTFRPYSDKLKADDSDQILNIPTLIEGRVLVRNGRTITTALVGADQVASTGFPVPTAGTQLANKQYVDDIVADAIAGISLEDLGFLKTDGSRPMDGYLNLGNHAIINLLAPFSPSDAANKEYVDAQIAALDIADLGFLKIDGSTPMEANLSLGTHRITNLFDPIELQDAATRYYVESFSSNRHLSNLCAGTAINQWLIPDGNMTQSLGAQQGIYGYVTPRNWASVLANEFISAGVDDLYLSSCSPDLDPDSTGRNVRIQADGTGLQDNADGGSVFISTAITGGIGIRGSIFVDALALDLNLSKITNLATPTAPKDAANKEYVDTAIAEIITASSSAGLLTIHAPLTIDGYTGDVSIGGSILANVANPILPSDAATKEYVDSLARLTVATVSSDYSITPIDRVVFVDPSSGPINVTLPSASGQAGLAIYIKRTTDGDNDVIINPLAGELIDGEVAYEVFLQWEAHTIVSDGTNWFVV